MSLLIVAADLSCWLLGSCSGWMVDPGGWKLWIVVCVVDVDDRWSMRMQKRVDSVRCHCLLPRTNRDRRLWLRRNGSGTMGAGMDYSSGQAPDVVFGLPLYDGTMIETNRFGQSMK